MHQLFQDMEIGEQESMPTNMGLEEGHKVPYLLIRVCFLKLYAY
jgi:hypothetical protein